MSAFKTKDEILTLLKEKGHRITPQRVAIFDFVLSSKDHPTSENIYHAIKQKYPSVSLATIYKNIHLLLEMGLISELKIEAQPARYDPNLLLHVNLICPKCHLIRDYESNILNQIEEMLEKEIGENVELQRINVNSICETCESVLQKKIE